MQALHELHDKNYMNDQYDILDQHALLDFNDQPYNLYGK